MLPYLVSACVCGNGQQLEFLPSIEHEIPIYTCQRCQVKHQKVEMSREDYWNFYATEYHGEHQKKIGCRPYESRYAHDCNVALERLEKYKDYIPRGESILDIGSGNGAFKDTAKNMGYIAHGLELNSAVIRNKENVFIGSLENNCIKDQTFYAITLHDVYEHLVDPIDGLKRVLTLLKNYGVVIIDFPNFFSAEGSHHWRLIQHLWYFTRDELENLLNSHGLVVDYVDTPIPAKFVFYCYRR